MNSFTLDTTVKQLNEKLLISDLGDEVVMMNMENGDYVGLNEIGNEIWRMIETPIKVSDICEKLRKTYDVSSEKCEASVIRILTEMQEEEIVQIVAG